MEINFFELQLPMEYIVLRYMAFQVYTYVQTH